MYICGSVIARGGGYALVPIVQPLLMMFVMYNYMYLYLYGNDMWSGAIITEKGILPIDKMTQSLGEELKEPYMLRIG